MQFLVCPVRYWCPVSALSDEIWKELRGRTCKILISSEHPLRIAKIANPKFDREQSLWIFNGSK